MKLKALCSALIFVLVGLLLFSGMQDIFVEKNSYGKYRNWKAQENVDVLVLGNSHAYNGIIPVDLEAAFEESHNAEVSVFGYGIYGMRIEQMYYFAKEILKDHVPDLILLETYAFCPLADSDREILARRAFDAMPISLNKIEAINYCVLEDRWSYYIPFIKYHSRWKELSQNDFQLVFDEQSWAASGKVGESSAEVCEDPGDGWFSQDTTGITELREITPTEKECFENLLALLEEKGVDLCLVSVPYKIQMGLDSIEQIKINNYLEENYVNGDSVRLLDMNRMWAEMDFGYSDLFNEGHVNQAGAAKVTEQLTRYLSDNYDIAAIAG